MAPLRLSGHLSPQAKGECELTETWGRGTAEYVLEHLHQDEDVSELLTLSTASENGSVLILKIYT